MDNTLLEEKSTLKFFLLVLLLSIPFWILGAMAVDLTKILPIKLPISALMTFCPLLAATILVYEQRKMLGVKELLELAFDFKKITDKKWYIPIVFVMPVIATLSYGYMKVKRSRGAGSREQGGGTETELVLRPSQAPWKGGACTHVPLRFTASGQGLLPLLPAPCPSASSVTGGIIPEPQLSLLLVFIFFFVFFIGAIGEEIGWSGHIIDPLQNQYGAFKASMIVGFIWAIWHIIPYYQAHQTPIWIVWQCIGTVFLRTIMVWIFNNTNKSVFAMTLFHTMINISPYLFPHNGSHYDPFIFAILIIITATAITWLWGSKTLARYRYT